MNDVVFRKIARSWRWECEMDVRCEFQFGGLAVGGNEILVLLKFNGFRQFCVVLVTFPGRNTQRKRLKDALVNEFCQRRNHSLSRLTSRAQARGTDDVLRESGTGPAIPRCLQRFVRPLVEAMHLKKCENRLSSMCRPQDEAESQSSLRPSRTLHELCNCRL